MEKIFAQQCVNSVCKCTNSAQCPDDTPICNTSTGECVKCAYTGVQGLHLPCAARANTLKSEWTSCLWVTAGVHSELAP